MRKALIIILVFSLAVLLLPTKTFAASASFSISGPSTLQTGETGTYKVKVNVDDAAGAQATLTYDSSFFKLVDGNVTDEWSANDNSSGTFTVVEVKLECIAAPGSSGQLSINGYSVRRYGDTSVETVDCGGASKTVTNPVPEPDPTPAPTAAPTPRRTATSQASATPTVTPTPTATPDSAVSTTPTPAATPDAWALAAQQISAAAQGATVSVQPGDTIIPAEVLALLKERGCVLTVDLGNCVCTIDGRNLGDSPVGADAIDLGVSMEKNEALSGAAGGLDIFQLHFNYSGELPGRFTYTLKAQGCAPGDVLYLYYYYALADVAECVQRAEVGADGNVTFEIYHCSGYFVSDAALEGAKMIRDEPAAQAGAVQAQPGVSVTVLVLCAAGAAVLGAAAAWLAGPMIKRRKTNE